jgi:kynurenine formamidase
MQLEGGVGNWGRWGSEDERGALNLVTPGSVIAAAHAVRTGKVYSLALPMSRTRTPPVIDRPPPDRLTRTAPADTAEAGPDGPPRIGSNEDMLTFSSHAGTHLDALSHVFEGDSFYNGHPVDTFSTRRGATKCSIERSGTFATRAVLLDVAALVGEQAAAGPDATATQAVGDTTPSLLPAGHTITAAELEACCERQGVEVEPGDAVLIRTGWLEAFRRDPSTPTYPQAGIGTDAAAWLGAHDVAVVGADNSAVEVLPFDGGSHLPVHVELLVHLGVGLLEHVWLADLAADECYRPLLVVGALPVVGATGSPVNPVAIG